MAVSSSVPADLPPPMPFTAGSQEIMAKVRPQEVNAGAWMGLRPTDPSPVEGSRTPGLGALGCVPFSAGQAGWDSDGWGGLLRLMPCSFPPAPPRR